MTILGSRDQYCVHQSAKKFERGVNEACNLMLGGTDLTKVGKTLGKDKRRGSSRHSIVGKGSSNFTIFPTAQVGEPNKVANVRFEIECVI